jgi:hypothetical protein
MKIITYATHSYGYFDELIKNPNVIALGMGTKWQGFTYKAKVILDYINNLPDDEIVIIVDGFDTIIKKTEGLEDKFKSMDCGILVSKEDNSGFSKIMPRFIEDYIKKRVFGFCKDNSIANSGLLMGYIKYIKEVYKIMGSDISDDDQRNLNKSCSTLPFLKIDINHEIFENCSSKKQVENSKAYFCQIPGEMSFTRTLRALAEYPKYLIPEILIFVLIIIIIIYGIRKKTPGKFRMPRR